MTDSRELNRLSSIALPQVREDVVSWLLVPALYCLASAALRPFGYNLFHFSAETGSIVIGVMALLVANISQRFSTSSTLLIASIGLGWCAAIDVLHMMSFDGMGLLPGDTTNLTSQLWIVARLLQALALLAAVLLMEWQVRVWVVHLACGLFALTCLTLVRYGLFPATFIPGEGLTGFKVVTEYLIIGTLVAAAVQVQRKRGSFTTRKYFGIQLALGAMVLSEFCFTLYLDMFDRFNEAGHLLKVFAYWFLFRALVEQTLLQPFLDRNHLLLILGERLKEMRCLNELTRIGQLHETNPTAFLAAVVDVLPAAMLHDKLAQVSIVSGLGHFGVAADTLPETRCITVPLMVEGQQLGTLAVGYPPQWELPEPLFLDEEHVLMNLIAQRVSAVLARQQSRETIQQLNRLYRMLSGVNRAVVHSSSQSRLMWEVFTILRDSQGFSFIGMAERSAGQQGFAFTHVHRLEDEQPQLLCAELHTLAARLWPAAGTQRRTPAMLKTTDIATPRLRAALERSGSLELALVPVSAQTELLGLVLAAAPAGHAFPPDQEKLLTEMGEDISFAMSHLRQGQRLLEAEEQVEDTERRYEVLFNQSPVPMTLMDATASTTLARNKAYENWLGAPLCDIDDASEWFRRVIDEPPERIEWLKQQLFDNVGKSFAPFGYFQFPETRLHDSSGRSLVATARLTIVEDRILVVFNDITQLKEKEQRLGESEARFRNMIEETLVGVMVVQDGRFVYVNPAFCQLAGWEARELIGGRLDDFAHVLQVDAAAAVPPETTLDASRQRVFEFRRKDGSTIRLFTAAGSMPWNAAAAEVMIVQDITEKMRYEERLRQSAALLENLAQQVPGVIYQYRLQPDGHASFPFATRNLWDIYEVHPDEVKLDATPVFLRIHPEDVQRVTESIQQSARDLSLWREDYRVVLPGQGLRWRSGFARPQKLDDGSVLWHGFIEDATARKEMEEELRQTNQMLQRSVTGTLEIISRIMDQRDPYTAGHQHRVGRIARLIGEEMGLGKQAEEMLELTGVVHDVGKIAVPTEILTKPTRLSDIELQIVKGHASAGYEMLKGTNLPSVIIDAIHQHHERLDGSGYPQGLKGDAITREARIIAVADVLESMSSHRPYRPSLGVERAVQELQRGRGSSYDPDVVDIALRIVRENRLPGDSAIH